MTDIEPLTHFQNVLRVSYDNPAFAVKRVVDFVQSDKSLVLEIGGGNTKASTFMAFKNPDVNFITSDLYDLGGLSAPQIGRLKLSPTYAEDAAKWKAGKSYGQY